MRAHLQIVFRTELAERVPAKIVPTGLPPEKELRLLLEGTGLRFQYINARTIAIDSDNTLRSVNTQDNVALFVSSSEQPVNGTAAQHESIRPSDVAQPETAQGRGGKASRLGELQEVIVTALKEPENLQEVPAAVSAFSADFMDTHEIRKLSEVMTTVPNVSVTFPNGDNGPVNYSIRGVTSTDYSPTQSKPIAIYQDEAIRDFQLFETFPPFDIEQIEVLRGPQGTLYGRNATAGAVNIISKRPGFDEDGYITGSYGNFDLRSAQGAYQLPLVDNVLAARVAFTYTKDDGMIKNLTPGLGDYEQTDVFAFRPSLYFKPSETFNATLRFNYFNSGGRNYTPLAQPTDFSQWPDIAVIPGVNRIGLSFYESAGLIAPDRDIQSEGLNLITEWKPIAGYTVTTVSAYDWGHWNDVADSVGLPIAWNHSDTYTQGTHQFVQELRVSSQLSGPFNWQGGLLYTNDRIAVRYFYEFYQDPRCDDNGPGCAGLGFPGGRGFIENAALEQSRSSYSGYFRGEYSITPTVKATAGIRRSYDNLSVPWYNASYGDTACTDCIPTIVDASRDAQFHNTSGELALDWKATANALLYASFKQGYRIGAVNDQAFNSPAELTIAPPETVNSYEAGFKSTLLNRALTFNVAVFQSNYFNQQIVEAYGGLFPLRSIPKARIKGIELETVARPLPAVQLNLSLGLLDPKYLEGIVNGVNVAGNQSSGAAKVNGSLGADITLYSVAGRTLQLNLNETYTSRIFNDTDETQAIEQPVQWLTNGRLAYTAGPFTVAAYGKNIFNLRSYTYGVDILQLLGYDFFQRIQPRTYGVQATMRF